MIGSRLLTVLSLAGAGLVLAASAAPAPQAKSVVVIHKSPTCGCCSKWVDHMKAAGFATEVHDMADVEPIKNKHRVPADLRSCHTALADGVVIEGHVPADLVKKLLAERSKSTIGLAVPGMVTGSPGMEGAWKDPYDVISFDQAGKTAVYAKR